jgi:DNA-binding transcriptional LysR family regulator
MSQINSYKLKISQLRALVAVAEHGNFSEAALHLELSQSAVSHAIASLEEELGVMLLSRGRHGAHLTSVGERILTQSREVLQLLQKIVQEANREKGLDGGSVRLASFRSVATHILPTVIAQFRSHFPGVSVMLTEYPDYLGVEQVLREGRADIGFTIIPTVSEFETWEILRDEFVVLLPPNQGVSSNQLTWEQLATYPLIFPSTNACYLSLRKHLNGIGFPLNIAYDVKEDSTIVSLVMQGLGAAILPRLAAEPVPEEIQVCRLPVPLERVIATAVLADALHPPAVFAFLEALKKVSRFSSKATV